MSAIAYMTNPEESRREPVTFATARGLRLAGHLYRARGGKAGDANPGVVMAGPMTSVKEQTLPHYAGALQDSGYTVLTFGNRNFRESDGEPRAHLDTYEQVEDLKNAVRYVLTRGDVDPQRIGLFCVCLGAGYGLEVAAMDHRVTAAGSPSFRVASDGANTFPGATMRFGMMPVGP